MDIYQKLHKLVDSLPAGRALLAGRILEALLEEFDDPLTPEEKVAMAQAREEFARGETVPLDVLKKELSDEV